jgi:hypothetical protein
MLNTFPFCPLPSAISASANPARTFCFLLLRRPIRPISLSYWLSGYRLSPPAPTRRAEVSRRRKADTGGPSLEISNLKFQIPHASPYLPCFATFPFRSAAPKGRSKIAQGKRGTSAALGKATPKTTLPLPARHERGEGRREGRLPYLVRRRNSYVVQPQNHCSKSGELRNLEARQNLVSVERLNVKTRDFGALASRSNLPIQRFDLRWACCRQDVAPGHFLEVTEGRTRLAVLF